MSAEATLAQAKAQLHQAQMNLERTRILSPVDGYVTNLLAPARQLRQCRCECHFGCRREFVLGRRVFRGDENLAPIRVGDPAESANGDMVKCSWPCRQYRPRDHGANRTTKQSRGGYLSIDLHLGARWPSASRSASISMKYRLARRSFSRHDRYRFRSMIDLRTSDKSRRRERLRRESRFHYAGANKPA